MPRYYFHILNGKKLIDDVGAEMADIDALKAEAVKFAGTILMSEQPTDMWEGIPWEMKVTDRPGTNLPHTHRNRRGWHPLKGRPPQLPALFQNLVLEGPRPRSFPQTSFPRCRWWQTP